MPRPPSPPIRCGMGDGAFAAGSVMLCAGPIAIDLIERQVTRAGRPLTLRHREYALLLALARRAGEVLPEMQLLESVWGLRFHPGTNVVAVHVSRLRAAIDGGADRALLRTVRGRGYTLDVTGAER